MKMFLIIIVIVSLIMLVGCSTPESYKVSQGNTYQLQNGDIVKCEHTRAYSSGTGLDLFSCQDGYEYLSQTNIKKLD